MTLAILVGFVVGFAVLALLGVRWTRRSAVPDDLRRADEAEGGEEMTAAKVRDRVFMYMNIYGGPKR